MLTQERLKELLHYDPDTGVFTRLMGFNRGVVNPCGVSIRVDGYRHPAARLVWLYVYGVHPSMCLIYLNGDKKDRRLCNVHHVEDKQEITQAFLKDQLHYNPETGAFTWLKNYRHTALVGTTAGSISNGYVVIKLGGVGFRAHRLAWLYTHGHFPPEQIDHINHKTDDNRLVNIRAVSGRVNMQNQKRYVTNKSGYTGVIWRKPRPKINKGCWEAYIRLNNVSKCLGSFKNKEDAIAARRAAEIKYNFHENHGKGE